jgi:hypothetical protein
VFDADIGVILQDKLESDQLLAVVEAAVLVDACFICKILPAPATVPVKVKF